MLSFGGHYQEATMMSTAIPDLAAFFEKGWNGHDVDTLMSLMADDCVFESASGPDACGTRYVGRDAVRRAFAAIFEHVPDVRFDEVRHLVDAGRAVSAWTFRGTARDGRRIEVEGCDLFTFENAKIARKSSFLKNRSA
jgi:steroid delta-isomerase-like uncharacterized protein